MVFLNIVFGVISVPMFSGYDLKSRRLSKLSPCTVKKRPITARLRAALVRHKSKFAWSGSFRCGRSAGPGRRERTRKDKRLIMAVEVEEGSVQHDATTPVIIVSPSTRRRCNCLPVDGSAPVSFIFSGLVVIIIWPIVDDVSVLGLSRPF